MWAAVVPHECAGDLKLHEVMRIPVGGQSLDIRLNQDMRRVQIVDPTRRLLQKGNTEPMSKTVMLSLPNRQRPSAGASPLEADGPRLRIAGNHAVDRHAEPLETGIQQHFYQAPALAVDIAVHPIPDVQPVVIA